MPEEFLLSHVGFDNDKSAIFLSTKPGVVKVGTSQAAAVTLPGEQLTLL